MKNEEANKQKKGEGMIRKLPTPLIVGLILAVILSGGIAYKVSSTNQDRQNAERQEIMDAESREAMEKELLQISDSLTIMDGSVTENLTALSEFNESTIERVEGLEKIVGEVWEIIEEYLKTETTERSAATESLTTISTELSTVQESLVSTKEKLVTLIEEMKTADRERETQIQKEFEKVAEMLDRSKDQLSQTYESLVSMMDVLRTENTNSTKEVVAVLEKAEKELSLSFLEQMESISKEIKDGNAVLNIKIEESMTTLQGRLTDLSSQINGTQTDISALLDVLSKDQAGNQKQIEEQFTQIKDKMGNAINDGYSKWIQSKDKENWYRKNRDRTILCKTCFYRPQNELIEWLVTGELELDEVLKKYQEDVPMTIHKEFV